MKAKFKSVKMIIILTLVALVFLVAIFAPLITPKDPY